MAPAWTKTDYPFEGYAGVTDSQPGSVANVPADGSAVVTVTLPASFPTQIVAVLLTPQGTGAQLLDAQEVVAGRTTSQFQLVVTGGQPGTTCTVNYTAYGE